MILGLGTAAALACGRDPQVTTRSVTLHVPKACNVDPHGYAEYSALGDFEPTAQPTVHLLANVGETLAELDESTRALVVTVESKWLGVGDVPATGNVDVLLLPSRLSCALSQLVGNPHDPMNATDARVGATLTPIAGRRVLVVGGTQKGQTGESPGTYLARLDTGEVVSAVPDLRTPRADATVTPFGEGALVAGGTASGGMTAEDAEVYSATLGGFQQAGAIRLSQGRSRHGAVVLATGETLLVGGLGDNGNLLSSMEIVDPVTRTVRAENVATLAFARQKPTVLRLASGEILVAGGSDAQGVAVTALEWFSRDAGARTLRTQELQELAAGSPHAFTALGAGGALAVVAPPAGAPAGFQNVWVIGADGVPNPATPVQASLAVPTLFNGAGGAPVLWTGSASTPGLWLQWQPWNGAFGALVVLDAPPAQVGDATASPDPGLAVWLDPAAPKVTALRFDTRGPYSSLPGSLLLADTSETAPDRLVAPGSISFDPAVGLQLGPGASAFVTDRSYADFTVDLDAPTGEPALVVLRDALGSEVQVGGACPKALATGTHPSSLHVERAGSAITWALSSGASGACGTVDPASRLSVGVRGVSAGSLVRNMRVKRLGAP